MDLSNEILIAPTSWGLEDAICQGFVRAVQAMAGEEFTSLTAWLFKTDNRVYLKNLGGSYRW